MLDRKQYESLLNKAKQEQIEEISSYLKESIELNAKIRELPFCPDDSKELLDEVSSIEIPRVGRPTKEVADE